MLARLNQGFHANQSNTNSYVLVTLQEPIAFNIWPSCKVRHLCWTFMIHKKWLVVYDIIFKKFKGETAVSLLHRSSFELYSLALQKSGCSGLYSISSCKSVYLHAWQDLCLCDLCGVFRPVWSGVCLIGALTLNFYVFCAFRFHLFISPPAGGGIEPWRNLVGRCKGQWSLLHHCTASRLSERQAGGQGGRATDMQTVTQSCQDRKKADRWTVQREGRQVREMDRASHNQSWHIGTWMNIQSDMGSDWYADQDKGGSKLIRVPTWQANRHVKSDESISRKTGWQVQKTQEETEKLEGQM